MSNENIAPINHGVVGTVGHTAAGAAMGGLKFGAKAIFYTAVAGAVIGGLWGVGLFGAVGLAGGTVATTIFSAIGGGLGGGLLGMFASPLVATIGAAKGGSQAASRVREEKGAHTMVSAQLEAYRAQAIAAQAAPTTVYAPSASNDNKYGSASTMNLADSNIQAASAQNMGRVDGLQLARA